MEQIREIIINYNVEIIIGLVVAFLVVLILYLIQQFRIGRITEKYNALVKDVEGVNLENLIFETMKQLEEVKADTEKLKEKYFEIDGRLKYAVQKIGLVKYNAFADMGSELSFSLALLDGNLNGIVITSIFGREYTTCYGKSIVKGKSKFPLSVEEMQAIDRAIKDQNQMRAY